jgi:hypothetical protein
LFSRQVAGIKDAFESGGQLTDVKDSGIDGLSLLSVIVALDQLSALPYRREGS